jgi:hypothetical protein
MASVTEILEAASRRDAGLASREQAALAIGKSLQTIIRMEHAGKLETVRRGNRVFYTIESVEKAAGLSGC